MPLPQITLGEMVTVDMWNDVVDVANNLDRDTLIPNTEFSTNRTLVITDRDKLLILTGSDNRTVTIPHNDTVAFDIGAMVAFCQGGTGGLTIAPASSVTIYTENSRYKTRGQHAVCAIIKTNTNTWRLFGNLKP